MLRLRPITKGTWRRIFKLYNSGAHPKYRIIAMCPWSAGSFELQCWVLVTYSKTRNIEMYQDVPHDLKEAGVLRERKFIQDRGPLGQYQGLYA